jgi:hypothetical protein
VNISDEAVEAACTLFFRGLTYIHPESKADMQKALDAAAPYIIQAWISDTSRLPEELRGYGPEGWIK